MFIHVHWLVLQCYHNITHMLGMASEKGLKLMYLNIRSLYKHCDELFLNCRDFDMIFVGETWLNDTIRDKVIAQPEFMLFRQDRPGPNRGGGLALYMKTVYGKYAHVLSKFSNTNLDLEQQWIEVDVPNHKKMLLVNLYHPPSGSLMKALENLRLNLSTYNNLVKRELVIMGDLNINLLAPRTTGYKEFKELCTDFNLTQYIKVATRITKKTRRALDVIATNMNYVKTSGVLDLVISDHLPVYIIKKKPKLKHKYTYVETRNMKNYKIENFHKKLKTDKRWLKYW